MPIPKIFFTYWEGSQLSILHYYTILSLHKLNLDEEIIIYTSNNNNNKLVTWKTNEHSIPINDTISLQSIININPNKIKLININFKLEYDFDDNISVVYKADFVRICKLYEHGGMWFDFDILFIKKIPDYLFNDKDFYYFSYSNTIPTGILFIKPKHIYLKKLLDESLKIIKNSKLILYQTIGPNLWNSFIYSNNDFLLNSKKLENKIAYPYDSENYNIIYDTLNDYTNETTICIHWYNGGIHSKEFINKFNKEYNRIIDPNRNIIEKYLYFINTI